MRSKFILAVVDIHHKLLINPSCEVDINRRLNFELKISEWNICCRYRKVTRYESINILADSKAGQLMHDMQYKESSINNLLPIKA